MRSILKYMNGDKVIWTVVVLLSIISLLTVYSSTGTLAYKYQHGNTMYYMLKHGIILLFGLFLMFLSSKLKYTYYSRIFQIGLYFAVPLLIFTLLFGEHINQATRVLRIPFIGLTFQSSDLAKITLIVFLARELTKRQDNIKSFKSAFVPLMVPIILVVIFILPANFSTAAIIFAISMVMLYIGRVNSLYLFGLMFSGLLIIALVIGVIYLTDTDHSSRVYTWMNRIESFAGGEKSEVPYQVEQAKIAIASGGIKGKGPGNSTQRNFLPHPYSDFIYAIIIEEYGLVGGAIILVLYLIFFFRSVRIAMLSPTLFGTFMVIGVSFGLVFQALINMGVAVNLLPVTGQPLPLVSMGGTSLWFSSLSIGIILSVSREIEENKKEEAATEHKEETVTA